MIYFDNNATTGIAPEVFEAMKPFLTEFYGNPSSGYDFARESKKAIETARESVGELLGARKSAEIIFTSSGTESDNWAVTGALEMNPAKKHIVTTRVEHEAVRRLCEKLETNGFETTWLDGFYSQFCPKCRELPETQKRVASDLEKMQVWSNKVSSGGEILNAEFIN